jgi:glutathione S-transferase
VNLGELTLYHFPGCPFSERIEILLALKGRSGLIEDVVVDISAPRPPWLLAKTGGATALPALETPRGVLMESAAILRFLDHEAGGQRIVPADPYEHAVEEMLAGLGGAVSTAGYRMIQNRDPAQRAALATEVDSAFARIDVFLRRRATAHPFLFDRFGWAELMLTPVMKRLWFLEYYEDYAIDPALARVIGWRAACLAHPAAQAHPFEEIVKLYHDYARGYGSGRVPEGRAVSSFTIEPHWSTRPMPPRDKWSPAPTDEILGLMRQG